MNWPPGGVDRVEDGPGTGRRGGGEGRRSGPGAGRRGGGEGRRSVTGALLGLGLDSVDIPRFARILDRRPALAERLFTAAERQYAAGLANPVPTLASPIDAEKRSFDGDSQQSKSLQTVFGTPVFLLHFPAKLGRGATPNALWELPFPRRS